LVTVFLKHRRHLVKFHPTECAKSRKLRINRSAAGNKKAETEQLESNDDTGVNFSKMGRHLDMDISEGATAKIETNETGEVSFLTVRITKVADGYECGMCGAVARTCFGDETRYIRHHIRAYHLGKTSIGDINLLVIVAFWRDYKTVMMVYCR